MNVNSSPFHEIVVQSQAGQSTFTIPKRYTNLVFVNAGAQGTVVKALDSLSNRYVAIKKVQHPFLTTMNAKRTYRELVLMTSMNHPNLIHLESAFSPQNSVRDLEEIYLVMEFMDYNLSQVIERLKLDHKNLSYFVYQMIVAMKYMHRSGIIHRDLKPSNIVVNDKCILKILDFGLARKKGNSDKMSIYVITRYYRSPEVILGLPYDEKVDVWSIGCIMAEMVLRRVLFRGIDRLDQWMKIVQYLGSPTQEFTNKLEHHARLFVRSKGRMEPIPMTTLFPDEVFVGSYQNAPQLTAANARDLLSKMLQMDPKNRISIDEAVQHPYINLWFDEKEWNAPLPENRYDTDMDLIEQPIEEWKELIFNEVKRYERQHDIFGTQSSSRQTQV